MAKPTASAREIGQVLVAEMRRRLGDEQLPRGVFPSVSRQARERPAGANWTASRACWGGVSTSFLAAWLAVLDDVQARVDLME